MGFIESLHQKARSAQKAIALPEAEDERTLRAAAEVTEKELARIILIGDEANINNKANELNINISGIEVTDPEQSSDYDSFAQALFEMRKHKGMTEDKAAKLMLDPTIYAPMMVKQDKADGYVSGAAHTTADTIRPALQIIKTLPGIDTVSSFFIMELPETSPFYNTNNIFFYTDGALLPDPTAEQLADIAIATAQSFTQLLPNKEPKVAFLSFPANGIFPHPSTEKVLTAARLTRSKAPEINIVESFDTADALTGGSANILIFPDLQAGNICYKLTERLAGAAAIGPFLQGIARPVSDLSRGCSARDIADTIVVTACQADR